MYIIVGLGNIGEKYQGTRHNVGRMVVSSWARAQGASFVLSKKYHAEIWEGEVDGERVLAMLPETFMNESGGAVKKAVKNKKEAERLIVVHDDIDLPLGVLRISFDRGPGGHNGVKSIVQAIKTEAFIRIRVGVSPLVKGEVRKPADAEAVLKWVMGDFKKSEKETLQEVESRVADAIRILFEKGLVQAMNMCN